MKIRWSQVLGIVLPILGIVVEIADGVNQAKLQEEEMREFEARMAEKYGLVEVENENEAQL